MSNPRTIKRITALAIVVVTCVSVAIFIKETTGKSAFMSHLARRLRGESMVKQTVDDLAHELKDTSFVHKLQDWSVGTLNSFNAGSDIAVKGATPNLPFRSIVVDPKYIPEFVQSRWQENRPEIVMLIGENGKSNSILIDWYNYGLIVSHTNYQLADLPWKPYYAVSIQPGVFAIWVDSK